MGSTDRFATLITSSKTMLQWNGRRNESAFTSTLESHLGRMLLPLVVNLRALSVDLGARARPLRQRPAGPVFLVGRHFRNLLSEHQAELERMQLISQMSIALLSLVAWMVVFPLTIECFARGKGVCQRRFATSTQLVFLSDLIPFSLSSRLLRKSRTNPMRHILLRLTLQSWRL